MLGLYNGPVLDMYVREHPISCTYLDDGSIGLNLDFFFTALPLIGTEEKQNMLQSGYPVVGLRFQICSS